MTFDERRTRWLLRIAVVLIGLGFWPFVGRGAGPPADPVLGGPVTTSTGPLPPPGDPARVPLAGFGESAITVTPPAGATLLSWCLLAAMTAEQRSHGLMGVRDLHGYSGMVFTFPEDAQDQFYMRGTPTPLSIAWIDSEGAVVSTANMAPCADKEGCRLYSAARPYRMAIEVPQGALARLGIVPGARVALSGRCVARTTS